MNMASSSLQSPHEGHDSASNVTFGFWLYLMTDCLLFASLFATFAVLRHHYAGGPDGRALFDLPGVYVETLFLLLSSVTNGFSLIAARQQRTHFVLAWLFLTAMFGMGFIWMEVGEFWTLVQQGHGPSKSAFLSAYFTLVGTHGAHVTVGLLWMWVMMIQVMDRGLTPRIQSRLVRLGMFWHFLDLIWVAVFSVVYLSGML